MVISVNAEIPCATGRTPTFQVVNAQRSGALRLPNNMEHHRYGLTEMFVKMHSDLYPVTAAHNFDSLIEDEYLGKLVQLLGQLLRKLRC